jgi:hypothetical protein
MTKPVLRILLTILMYTGVGIFLFPYITGEMHRGIPFLIGGALLTVVCGLLRCFLTEGECSERTIYRPNP